MDARYRMIELSYTWLIETWRSDVSKEPNADRDKLPAAQLAGTTAEGRSRLVDEMPCSAYQRASPPAQTEVTGAGRHYD
jgi:hypothetical protein